MLRCGYVRWKNKNIEVLEGRNMFGVIAWRVSGRKYIDFGFGGESGLELLQNCPLSKHFDV